MKLIENRQQILEISKKLLDTGLIHNGQGNISVYNREEGLVAITPSAVPYDERKPEDICVVDLAGNLVEGKWKTTSETPLHLIYYNRREDVNAVIHTHASKSTVLGIIGDQPMPMVLNEAAMCIGGAVPIAPYARPGSEELAVVTCEAMGNGIATIMAHHGVITVGPTLDWAFLTAVAVESTAEAIIMARSMGCEPNKLEDDEVNILREMMLGHGPKKA